MEQTKSKRWAKVILAALLSVACMFVIMQSTTLPASAASVVTWNGDTLKYAMACRYTYGEYDTDPYSGPDTIGGIKVDYTGGKANMRSGMYNMVDDSTGAVTKHIRFTDATGELSFTSMNGNAFITKIVINFDNYDTPVELSDIDVNHNAWTDVDVKGSDGKHTLTLEGPAARTVTLRNHYRSYYYDIKGITSIQIYLTENLWTSVPDGFRVIDLEDGGLKIIHGNPEESRTGEPFFVRIGGHITYFAEAQSNNTYSYTFEDPRVAFSVENYPGDGTIWVGNDDDFRVALESPRFHTIYIANDIHFNGGFTISRNVTIDLRYKQLFCDGSAEDKTIRVTGGNSRIISIDTWGYSSHNIVWGFDKIEVTGGTLNIEGGAYDLPEGMSGNVRITGGLFKPHEENGIDFNYIRRFVVGSNGVRLKESVWSLYDRWGEVFPHVHSYYKRFTEHADGSLSYIHRCDGCDHTVSNWTLTGEELGTLLELNGGAFTDVWGWDRNNPGTATLRLRISEETYNTAIAEPYNMDPAALSDLKDQGFLCVAEGGNYKNYVTVETERNDPDCYSRKASYTFRGHEYTHIFENAAVPVHNFRYDYVWELGEEETVNVTDARTGAMVGHTVAHPSCTSTTRTCLDCGLVESATGIQAQNIQRVSATYVVDGSISFPVTARFSDGTSQTESYVYVLPKHTLVYYPYVAPTCEDFGFDEVWYDEETHQCYSNAEGTQFVANNNDHLATVMYDNGEAVDSNRFYDGNPDFGYLNYVYVSRSASGDLTLSALTNEMKANMSSITDMPADFVNVGVNDVWSLPDFPRDSTIFVIYSNEENPAQVRPIRPLRHLYNPETEMTWHWGLEDADLYSGDCPVPAKGKVPKVTASFVCDRCGETIMLGAEVTYAEGTSPTYDADGHLTFKADVVPWRFGYNEKVESPEHEMDVPRRIRVYQKVEAKEPTFTEAGNIECYLCSDGKHYVKDGENYIEITDGSWFLPALGSETIYTNTWEDTPSGNLAAVSGCSGGSYGMLVENGGGTPTASITVTAEPGYDLDKVVFHIGSGEDRSEYGYVDKGQFSLSDDCRTITVTNIDAKTVTLYTNFCDWDYMDPGEPDPDMPDWEPYCGSTYFRVNSVEIYVTHNNETIYTKVPATAATPTAPGNTEYYTGSDGKFYVKNGDNYTEIAENSWVIPVVTVTKVNAVAPTPNAAGNSEYYSGSDGKYYVKNGNTYTEVAQNSWIIPAVTVTKVEATSATAIQNGNTEYYIGSDGKFYVKNGNIYTEIAENSWIIPALGAAEMVTYSEDTTIDGPLVIDRQIMNIASGVTVRK